MKHHAVKLPSRASSSAAAAAAMGAHKLPRAIAKAPPRKVRIVHVLAPEVIKTEARHFRELVQRLTGMPAAEGGAADAASSSQPGSCDTAGDVGAAVAKGAGAAPGAGTINTAELNSKAEESDAEAEASTCTLDEVVFFPWLEDTMDDLFSSSKMCDENVCFR
ncbi:hypothetical protein GUJ93_ZPchr0004g38409 [Zizania palustris]|uniref:VQ domain-containing protein n=1 Tax=Zizania palustris TaxID=103762 RepID=A0A8J5T1M1_ZIZPA|nr:hypothetical protein GUJ93_ZPchr0004g38409 [Zizania palustris]